MTPESCKNIDHCISASTDAKIRIYESSIMNVAMHASAPVQHLCADCTMAKEPCPTCYEAWWRARHPEYIKT